MLLSVGSMILLSGEELDGSSKAIGSQCVGLSSVNIINRGFSYNLLVPHRYDIVAVPLLKNGGHLHVFRYNTSRCYK